MKDSERDPREILRPVERLHFNLISQFRTSRFFRWWLNVLQATLGMSWVEFGTATTVRDHHFERFLTARQDKAILLVSNHRSYFDMFVIAARLFKKYGRHHRIYFPVRSKFFYDNIAGLLVNLFVAYGAMFPPIIREKTRSRWNKYAIDVLCELLNEPSVLVGFHPEGRRGTSKDPYELLEPQLGCGEIAYRSKATVIPVFLQGFPRYAWSMIPRNFGLSKGERVLVHMVMGEPIDLEQEYSRDSSRETFQTISSKIMERIASLGEEEREIRTRT